MANKGKLYKINNKNTKRYESNDDNWLIQIIVGIVVYAFVLVIASYLFKGIYVLNFFWAIVAAIILSVLNYLLKPALIFLTLPLTISTFGIAYPITNMIILKICDILLGNAFNVYGFIRLFIISIFISLLKIILDNLITKKVGD